MVENQGNLQPSLLLIHLFIKLFFASAILLHGFHPEDYMIAYNILVVDQKKRESQKDKIGTSSQLISSLKSSS